MDKVKFKRIHRDISDWSWKSNGMANEIVPTTAIPLNITKTEVGALFGRSDGYTRFVNYDGEVYEFQYSGLNDYVLVILFKNREEPVVLLSHNSLYDEWMEWLKEGIEIIRGGWPSKDSPYV